MRPLAILLVVCFHACVGAASAGSTSIDWTRARLLDRSADAEVYDPPAACALLRPGQRIELDKPPSFQTRVVLVSGPTGRVVRYQGFEADSSLVTLGSKLEVARLVLTAHLMKPKGEKGTIMFPFAAAFDADCSLLGELRPVAGSGTRDNTLSNIFDLPPGTRHLLVYADPRAIEPGLLDSKTPRRDHDLIIGGTLAAFTGILGVIPFALASDSEVARGKAAFAPFGMILVHTEPEWHEVGLAPRN